MSELIDKLKGSQELGKEDVTPESKKKAIERISTKDAKKLDELKQGIVAYREKHLRQEQGKEHTEVQKETHTALQELDAHIDLAKKAQEAAKPADEKGIFGSLGDMFGSAGKGIGSLYDSYIRPIFGALKSVIGPLAPLLAMMGIKLPESLQPDNEHVEAIRKLMTEQKLTLADLPATADGKSGNDAEMTKIIALYQSAPKERKGTYSNFFKVLIKKAVDTHGDKDKTSYTLVDIYNAGADLAKEDEDAKKKTEDEAKKQKEKEEAEKNKNKPQEDKK